MDKLLQALGQLNSELKREGVVLNLNVVGGFSLFLQNLGVETRESHDIDAVNRLTENVKQKVRRIGQELGIDLRWLNDDIYSISDELAFVGIDLERLQFSPNKRIDFSNIHLNVIRLDDFMKLKLFAIFAEVYDFMQYNKSFERDQDLHDVKTIVEIGGVDHMTMLDAITHYIQDSRYRSLTQKLLSVYLAGQLSNTQINDFLKANRG